MVGLRGWGQEGGRIKGGWSRGGGCQGARGW